MIRYITLIASICFLGLMSCKNTTHDNQTITKPEPVIIDEIVNSTAMDEQGRKLEMSFNNTKNIAQVTWQGQKIELQGQIAASGIWYTNDHYELRGKGGNISLARDGKVLFESITTRVYGEKRIFIAAETKDCDAGVMRKECLQVKYDTAARNWELFYEPIEGFKHEKGYEYELIVLDERVDNPPADGSSIRYKLVKEIAKIKK